MCPLCRDAHAEHVQHSQASSGLPISAATAEADAEGGASAAGGESVNAAAQQQGNPFTGLLSRVQQTIQHVAEQVSFKSRV